MENKNYDWKLVKGFTINGLLGFVISLVLNFAAIYQDIPFSKLDRVMVMMLFWIIMNQISILTKGDRK